MLLYYSKSKFSPELATLWVAGVSYTYTSLGTYLLQVGGHFRGKALESVP